MKTSARKIFFFVFLFLVQSFASTIFAQKSAVQYELQSQKENSIEIKYNPKASDKINSPETLFLVFGPSSISHDREELVMKQAGNTWVTTYSAPEYPDFVSFYFASTKKMDKGPNDNLYRVSLDGENIVKTIPATTWRQQMEKKIQKEKINKEAPKIDGLTDLDGNPVNPEKFRDKVLIIDFWASWCQPCLQAFPYLEKVYKSYENNQDVKFLIVNSALGDTIEEARKWKRESNYSFPIYFSKNRKFTDAFGVRRLPTTLVIGRDRKIKYRKVGFDGLNFENLLKLKIDILLK